jgi:hypothetical protein
MKHIVIVALMLNLGVAAAYAQEKHVKMTFSGSMVATTINLAPDTITDEEQLEGNGTLGRFTFRKLRTDAVTPQPTSGCSGPTQANIPVVMGGGVLRFSDGSLLTVTTVQGALCIDFMAQVAQLNETHQITGGTGRFKNASGTLTLTSTVTPVLASSPTFVALLTNSGKLEGTIQGLRAEEDAQDKPR